MKSVKYQHLADLKHTGNSEHKVNNYQPTPYTSHSSTSAKHIATQGTMVINKSRLKCLVWFKENNGLLTQQLPCSFDIHRDHEQRQEYNQINLHLCSNFKSTLINFFPSSPPKKIVRLVVLPSMCTCTLLGAIKLSTTALGQC